MATIGGFVLTSLSASACATRRRPIFMTGGTSLPGWLLLGLPEATRAIRAPRPYFAAGSEYFTIASRCPISSLRADTTDRCNNSTSSRTPNFYPTIPSLDGLQAAPQVTEEISSSLRAPYIIQSSATIERQLPWNTTLAVTYTNSHGLHQLLTNDINAPLPETYIPGVAGSGLFPLGQPEPVFLMQSSGLYNQNQLVVNVNARVNPAFSIFGFYVLNHAMSNTDGLGTSPPNPYNFTGQYGPAATDVRNRATLGGSINSRWNIRLNPFVVVQSGVPFDITTGSDLYGTTLFNARPGFRHWPV